MSDFLLEAYEPQSVLRIFDEITKIPRETGNEAAISRYLMDFAKSNDLECHQDEFLNVLIRKPASAGYENDKGYILQAHMDMVCEKNNDSRYDFSKDPIRYEVEGDHVVAKETTLGADNGLGMALILAILKDKTLNHPEIEAVFTTDEEVGLTGAENFDSGVLRGDFLINLDGGPENLLTAGSAGGPTIDVSIPLERNERPDKTICLTVSITGLQGGHSGQPVIAKGRGNANKLMFRLLYNIFRITDMQLITVSGGLKGNAIPREAYATFCVPESDQQVVQELIEKIAEEYRNEYRIGDPGLTVTLQQAAETATQVLTDSCTHNILSFGYLCDTGIQRMCLDLEDTIESSNSLGVVSMNDDSVVFRFVTRSILKSMYTDMVYRLECLASVTNGSCIKIGDCTEWEFKPDSELRAVCGDVYRSRYNEEPIVIVEHVGLECGAIMKNVDHPVDALSLGPLTGNYHTPGEWFSISSTERFWGYLKEVLQTHIPKVKN